MIRLAGLASCVLAALAASCEHADMPAAPAKLVQSGDGAASFPRTDARLLVAHTGVRRLEFSSGSEPALYFRESITTDGHGNYSVEPLGPQGTSVPDWGVFELTQRAREGFLFRYRDFTVRDPELFESNWNVMPLAPTQVAGRACQAYRLVRVVGEAIAYEVSVDRETGLILASHEFDAGGREVASMDYESLQLQPDLSAVVWHVPANDERPFDAHEYPRVPVAEPRLLPDGFAPLELKTVSDGQGEQWLKRTYSDGIEPLFFLQRLDEPTPGKPLRQRARDVGTLSASPSAVVVFHLGPVTAVQGELEGFNLLVIGKTSEAELLDLIESALP